MPSQIRKDLNLSKLVVEYIYLVESHHTIEVALEIIEKVMGKNAGQYKPRLEHRCFKR